MAEEASYTAITDQSDGGSDLKEELIEKKEDERTSIEGGMDEDAEGQDALFTPPKSNMRDALWALVFILLLLVLFVSWLTPGAYPTYRGALMADTFAQEYFSIVLSFFIAVGWVIVGVGRPRKLLKYTLGITLLMAYACFVGYLFGWGGLREWIGAVGVLALCGAILLYNWVLHPASHVIAALSSLHGILQQAAPTAVLVALLHFVGLIVGAAFLTPFTAPYGDLVAAGERRFVTCMGQLPPYDPGMISSICESKKYHPPAGYWFVLFMIVWSSMTNGSFGAALLKWYSDRSSDGSIALESAKSQSLSAFGSMVVAALVLDVVTFFRWVLELFRGPFDTTVSVNWIYRYVLKVTEYLHRYANKPALSVMMERKISFTDASKLSKQIIHKAGYLPLLRSSFLGAWAVIVSVWSGCFVTLVVYGLQEGHFFVGSLPYYIPFMFGFLLTYTLATTLDAVFAALCVAYSENEGGLEEMAHALTEEFKEWRLIRGKHRWLRGYSLPLVQGDEQDEQEENAVMGEFDGHSREF